MEHRGRVSVAVILFDGVNSIDVAGPVEAFGCVRTDPGGPGYSIESWTLADSIVRSESGLRLYADGPPPPRPAANILMIPGGKGIRVEATLSKLSSWLRSNHQGFAKIVSICTGAYALAEAGLLEGRQITTHWAHATDLQNRNGDTSAAAAVRPGGAPRSPSAPSYCTHAVFRASCANAGPEARARK